MTLAFILYKYFPFGGLQRDFMRIALECQRRGHDIRVYTLIWEGDVPDGFEVLVAPVRSIFNHRRNEKFTAWVRADLARRPVQRVIGFNKMPGLDVYYAADACFEEKAQTLRNPLYRQWGRYRHFAGYERAVFDPTSKTEILMISEVQQPLFVKHYGTQAERFHLLPPGISQDRRAPANAADVRAEFRREFGLEEDDLLLVQIGSGFKTKGLDRSLKALAALPKALRRRTRLIAIGQDDPKPFLLQIAALGLNDQVQILKGRSDIPRFLLGADLLIHPAYNENTGTVLLEALVSGLPVLVTDVCGYAHYIAEADAGRVLPSPFEQDSLNRLLAEMLEDAPARAAWSRNGLAYADHADLYSMPQRAADLILGRPHEAGAGRAVQAPVERARPVRGGGGAARQGLPRTGEGAAPCAPRSTGAATSSRSTVASAGARSPRTCSPPSSRCSARARSGRPSGACTRPATMTAVAYGERGSDPARQHSFIVTEELAPTVDLEVFSQDWRVRPPPPRLKRALVEAVARMVGDMHRAGVNHRDCYICHFLLHTDKPVSADDFRLSVIDLHRAQTRDATPKRWRNKDLAALYFCAGHRTDASRQATLPAHLFPPAVARDTARRGRPAGLDGTQGGKLYERKQRYGDLL